MTDFQAEQFENTTWSSTKSTTPNFVIYRYRTGKHCVDGCADRIDGSRENLSWWPASQSIVGDSPAAAGCVMDDSSCLAISWQWSIRYFCASYLNCYNIFCYRCMNNNVMK
jgi:hypothetical protein